MSINTNDNLIVSSSPHLVDDITTSKIMTYVLIAPEGNSHKPLHKEVLK